MIGGVWNPSLHEPRKWRVMSHYSTVPIEGEKKDRDMVILNEGALIEEIRRMGDGIVASIEIVKEGGEGGVQRADDASEDEDATGGAGDSSEG